MGSSHFWWTLIASLFLVGLWTVVVVPTFPCKSIARRLLKRVVPPILPGRSIVVSIVGWMTGKLRRYLAWAQSNYAADVALRYRESHRERNAGFIIGFLVIAFLVLAP